MKALLATLALMGASPALAMNWEGHDDYMPGFPPALLLMDAIPEAKPLPSRDCPVSWEQHAANPYEQIPLPHHRCGPPPKEVSPQR